MSGVELFTLPALLGGGAVTLGGVASAAGLAGTALSAVSSIQQGEAASKASSYNADRANESARIINQQTSVNEDAQRRKARTVLGNQAAAAAEVGGGLTGSFGDTYQQSVNNATLDSLNIRYQGLLESRNQLAQAGLDKANASASGLGGYLGAGASLLKGAADYSVQSKKKLE